MNLLTKQNESFNQAYELSLVKNAIVISEKQRIKKLISMLRSAWKHIAEFFCRNSDLSLNEWHRLEYRREYPTRDGERMNHQGIR